MEKNWSVAEKRAKRDRLERRYFKVSIVAGIFTVLSIVLNLFFGHVPQNSEQSPVNSTNIVNNSGYYIINNGSGNNVIEGDGNHVIEGNGNMAFNAATSGDNNINVAGDYYNQSNNIHTGSQEEPQEPQDFEDHNERLACSADLIEQGKYSEAQKFLKKYLQMENLDEQTKATIRFNLGVCCLHTGDYHQAVTYLADAADKFHSFKAYYNLGCAYMGEKEYSQAWDAFETALELSEEADSTATRADQEQIRAALENAETEDRRRGL